MNENESGFPRERVPPQPQPRPRPPKKTNWVLPIILLSLLGFFFVLFIGVVFFIVTARGPEKVKISKNSVLKLKLSSPVQEYMPSTSFEVLFDNRQAHFFELLQAVDQAAADDDIEGIWLEPGPGSGLGWAQSQELRAKLKAFKDSGKWIMAIGDIWGENEYYLASVANQVYMVPEALFMLDGFSLSSSFYTQMLAKMGINIHVEAYGEFKGAYDGFRFDEMSDAQRESYQAILNVLEGELYEKVTADRPIDQQALKDYMAGPFNSMSKAVEAGLLDELLYPAQLKKRIAEKVGVTDIKKLRLINWRAYANSTRPSSSNKDQIAVVQASGVIQPGNEARGSFGDPVVTPGGFLKGLREARENKRVKAIVLRIDSPGGSVLASDVIWHEIVRTIESGKPIIASMGNMAASGGYYLAMSCDRIFANETTITGSIGVIAMRPDVEQLYEKLLINVDVIKSSDHSDWSNISRGLSESEIAAFRSRIRESYNAFVTKVAESRNIPFDDIEPYARGRTWMGIDAANHKLVDELGTLEDAVKYAAEQTRLKNYQVTFYPREEDFATLFKKEFGGARGNDKLEAILSFMPREVRTTFDLFLAHGNPEFAILALALNMPSDIR